jgi:hypothetical protein
MVAACISKPARKAPSDGGGGGGDSGDAPIDADLTKPLRWKVHEDFNLDLGNFSGFRLVFDPTRQEVVVYDDTRDALWSLTTTGWVVFETTPVDVALKRGDPGFMFDPVTQQLRLFGGSNTPGSYINEEYVYVPGSSPPWVKVTTARTLQARAATMLVAGKDMQGADRIYLIGGYDGAALADVDERVNGNWEMRHEADFGNTLFSSPGMASVWDENHHRILSLEGLASATSPELHAYDLDQDHWTCLVCDGPKRHSASLVHIPDRDLTLLIGGTNDMGSGVDGTMVLVEDAHPHWEQFGDPMLPPAREAAGVTYDPSRKAVIMYGGTGQGSGCASSQCGDTWELSPDP